MAGKNQSGGSVALSAGRRRIAVLLGVLVGVAGILAARPNIHDSGGSETPNRPEDPKRLVGEWGNAGKFIFDGNTSFPEAKLRHALRKDMDFVLASHPAEPFAALPEMVRKALTRGYLNEGFPNVKIEVSPDLLAGSGRLRIRIDEGPRYRMGAIRVEGGKSIDAEILRQKLTVPSIQQYDNSLAGLVRKTMEAYVKTLPPEEDGKVGENPQNPLFDPFAFMKSQKQSSQEADWEPGEPASFSMEPANPLIVIIRQRLAEMGYPLVDMETAYELSDDGRADLKISIKNEGSLAMVGRIRTVGAMINSEKEVVEAAGLKSGEMFNPRVIDDATIQLWNCGRFFPFEITSSPSVSNPAAVDILIRVVELKGAPALAAKVAPDTDAVRRFITTVNDWMCTGNHEDFVWSSGVESGEDVEIGVSSRDGVVFRRQIKGSGDHQWASASNKEILFDIAAGDRKGKGKLPGLAALSGAFFNILPDGLNQGQMSFGFGFGVSTSTKPKNPLGMEILLSPAMPFIKPEKFRREGNRVIYQEKGKDLLSIDIQTALPIAASGGTFVFKNGCVQGLHDQLARSFEKGDVSLPEILDASVILMELISGNGKKMDKGDTAWLSAAALLLKPDSFKQLKGWVAKLSDWSKDSTEFIIPVDGSSFPADGAMMQLLIGLGAITISESIAPPGSWASDLGREMVFIYGGKTKHTKRTMEKLLSDPSMGPLGAWLASKVVKSFDPAVAAQFLTKAERCATAEGFRRDWKLVLNSQPGLMDVMEESLTTLKRLGADEEKELLSLLDPSLAGWLRDFLAQIKQRTSEGGLMEWLTPQMDALWTHVLDRPFRQYLGPVPDPVEIPKDSVAKVNGKPIRPWLLATLRDGFFQTGYLQPPSIDPSKAWTNDRLLASAVRVELICQEAERRGMTMTAQKTEEFVAQRFPDLKGAKDDAWIAAVGLPVQI